MSLSEKDDVMGVMFIKHESDVMHPFVLSSNGQLVIPSGKPYSISSDTTCTALALSNNTTVFACGRLMFYGNQELLSNVHQIKRDEL